MPQIQAAWECGQALFQEDLARATANSEEMESLSMIGFAEDCYAAVDARRTYPHDPVQQAWATSRYMLAWWQHVLAEQDTSLSGEMCVLTDVSCGCDGKAGGDPGDRRRFRL